MIKKIFSGIILSLFLSSLLLFSASAQNDGFTIHLQRNFGYGGGANVRGTFTIKLVGDEAEVEWVTFLIDGESMAEDGVAPFQFKFQTDDYGYGPHLMTAEVLLINGRSVITPSLQYNFVSPAEQREQVTTILVGIGGAIIVAMALAALIQMLMVGGRPKVSQADGSPRNYGILGGTICPKCGSPFPRHIWGMNLVIGRLDRCDHCKKWVMTVRATPEGLRAAEGQGGEMKIEVENLPKKSVNPKDMLEDTKYIEDI